MSDLITIYNTEMGGTGIKSVNARDLHIFLEVGKVFGAWMAGRIKKYNFVENEDYVCFPKRESGTDKGIAARGGHNKKDYHLSIDMAKELAMVEKTDKGKEARQYFIECEKKLMNNESAQLKALSDPVKLRDLLIDYSGRLADMEKATEENRPKVELADAIQAAQRTWDFSEVAKMLSTNGEWTIGRNTLMGFLRHIKVLMKGSNQPYQKWVDKNFFYVQPKKVNGVTVIGQTRVTGEGLMLLTRAISKAFDGRNVTGKVTPEHWAANKR